MDHPKNVRVILNPASSGGGGARLQAKLERELTLRGVPFSVKRSDGPGHIKTLAQEATRDGTDLILLVGGDGTIHDAANGILTAGETPPPIAVIPVGTGNDFYRMVCGSRDLGAALDVAYHGTPRDFDVGRVWFEGKDSYFVNLLGVGIDVEVLRKRANFPRLGGLPQYLAALVSALATYRPMSYRITLEGRSGTGEGDSCGREGGSSSGGVETIEDRTILMAVTVGPSVGGGFLLNPDASPYDGLLDLFFVKTLGMLKLARYIPKVIRGTHQGVPELFQRKVTGATVRRSDGEPFFFEMDGEGMPDPVTSLELAVVPGALRVMVPGGAS